MWSKCGAKAHYISIEQKRPFFMQIYKNSTYFWQLYKITDILIYILKTGVNYCLFYMPIPC